MAAVIRVGWTILRKVSKTNSRTTVMDFRIADFSLFKDLLGMIP